MVETIEEAGGVGKQKWLYHVKAAMYIITVNEVRFCNEESYITVRQNGIIYVVFYFTVL